MPVVSLMYHVVVSPVPSTRADSSAEVSRYKVNWDVFREHLDAIAAAGGRPEGVQDIQARESVRWPLALTFDDGGASAEQIGEALRARGWTGHFFITLDFVGRPGFLDEAGIRRLAEAGHASERIRARITFLSAVSPRAGSWRSGGEVSRPSARSSEVAVAIGSVPGGYSSRRVERAAARAGLQALFTSEPVASVRRVDGCVVLGRYAILRNTDPAAVARLARGEPAARFRQLASWKARGLAKKVLGARYRDLRARLLEDV